MIATLWYSGVLDVTGSEYYHFYSSVNSYQNHVQKHGYLAVSVPIRRRAACISVVRCLPVRLKYRVMLFLVLLASCGRYVFESNKLIVCKSLILYIQPSNLCCIAFVCSLSLCFIWKAFIKSVFNWEGSTAADTKGWVFLLHQILVCVINVIKIRILLIAVSIFLEKSGGEGHVWMVFLIRFNFEVHCFHDRCHMLFDIILVMNLASRRVK